MLPPARGTRRGAPGPAARPLLLLAALLGVARASLSANVSLAGGAAVASCGSSSCLRLAASSAGQAGAAWQEAAVDPLQGWEARVTVRMAAGASTACPVLGEAGAASCLQRGGHGLALVVQDAAADPLAALGDGGRGLGYANLTGAVAVELDTWFDPALDDLYDNHVAVLAAGPAAALPCDHRAALGTTAEVRDLGDGEAHELRVVYRPAFDEAMLHPDLCGALGTCGRTQATDQLAALLAAGMGDAGLGSLAVFLDGAADAALVVPLNLDWAVGRLSAPARAGLTVGLTASTGDAQWQAHDVERWEMCDEAGACSAVFVP